MEAFLLYLGKVALAMGAFYLVFLVLFQKQKQFKFNRIYLLASMGISYLIPLITLTFTKQVEASPMPVFTDYNFGETAPVAVTIEKLFEWYDYLFIILMAGVAGFTINFLVGNLKALCIIRKSYKKEDLGFAVRITTEDVHPFSFFNKVIVSTKVLSHPNLPLILAHETLHIKEKHTFDILISEILFLFQWFNPFAWLMKDAVKTNLEFITDDYVTKFNDRETYQLAMVSLADKKGIAPFLNALNGSQLKNRIIMMKKKTTNRFALVKQLAIIPVLTLLIIGLSNKEFRAEVIESPNKAQIEKPAEKKVVKGKVTDENGNPLAGVNIVEKDKEDKILEEVITDKEGNFSIEIKIKPVSLVVSLKGYKDQFFGFYGEGSFEKNFVLTSNAVKSQKLSLATGQEEAPFLIVEQMPEFPGGDAALSQFIANSIKYPEIARKNGIEGKVYVSFVIDTIGKITRAKVSKGIDPSLDYEAVRVINSLPKWNPGRQGGRAVPVSFTLQVIFGNPETKGLSSLVGDKLLLIVDGKEVDTDIDLRSADNEKISSILGITVQDIKSIEVLKDASSIKLYGEKGKNGVVLITTKKNPKTGLKEEAPFVIVEQMPQFQGGENGLKEYFAQNMQFPSEVKKDSLGTVFVRFTVTKDGKVENAKIAKKDHPALEAEALRLISSMPDWKPGIQSGKAVDVSYTLPVKFGDKKPTGSGNKFLWIVDGKEVDIDNFDNSTIKSKLVLNDEASIKPYGEKAKNGVVFASTRDNPSINSEKELIQLLAKQIRYPEAAREKNVKGEVKLFIKYDETGRMRSINDEPVNNAYVFRDEIIIANKEKDYKPTDQEKEVLFTLLKNEAYRTIGTINQINVAEMKDKTVQFTFKFELQ